MLALLAVAALTSVRYAFPATPSRYDLQVQFEGFLPVLGGKEGSVDVRMRVDASGMPPDAEGMPRVVSEITELTILLNGARMPMTARNVQMFFPRTTVSLTPEGRMVKTDAPKIKLPARLPGLDAQRFPEISYLPIEFPVDGVVKGVAFRYEKPFGDSRVTYEVTPAEITERSVELRIKLNQTYTAYEDDRGNPVETEAGAYARVMTEVSGEGKASFDRVRQRVSSLEVEAMAAGHVVNLGDKRQSDRKLRTKLKVNLLPDP